VAPKRTSDQAKEAIFDLQECVNRSRSLITNRQYRATVQYADKMQRCLNRLRRSIETLTGFRRTVWKVKDHLWGWLEFAFGLLIGGILVLPARALGGEAVLGLFVAELLLLGYLMSKEK
jgi:hypothetical protein